MELRLEARLLALERREAAVEKAMEARLAGVEQAQQDACCCAVM